MTGSDGCCAYANVTSEELSSRTAEAIENPTCDRVVRCVTRALRERLKQWFARPETRIMRAIENDPAGARIGGCNLPACAREDQPRGRGSARRRASGRCCPWRGRAPGVRGPHLAAEAGAGGGRVCSLGDVEDCFASAGIWIDVRSAVAGVDPE